MSKLTYQLAADMTLLLHTLFVLFVVLGLVLVLLGAARGWAWVKNPVFRWSHLAAIAVVVGQAWLGVICPLTSLEMYLRDRAGDVVYAGSFIAHWLKTVLYYDAPSWVFVLLYSLFAMAVLWCWFAVPPTRNRKE